ncbi:MAG: hypothetical protein AAGG06_19765 [Pseudomonadota bacterium]
MTSRMAPRRNAEAICALVDADKNCGLDAYGSALLRLLPIALGRRVVFHRPGSPEITFDESWVISLLTSIKRGDADSTLFALSSRISRPMRGQVRYLARGFADRLDTAELELF